MTQYTQLDQLFEQNKGIVRTSQALALGINKPVFYAYARERQLEKVAHGIYACQDTWLDQMYVLHLQCPGAVFSHDSALLFHNLTDREPLNSSVTVQAGYNATRLRSDGVKVYSVRAELMDMGLTTALTTFGHSVPTYDMERTICDVIRSRNNIEIQTFQDALRRYVLRKDKDLQRLFQYSKEFKVEKLVQNYLRILL